MEDGILTLTPVQTYLQLGFKFFDHGEQCVHGELNIGSANLNLTKGSMAIHSRSRSSSRCNSSS